MSKSKGSKSSSLPTVLIGIAAVGTIAYLVFFRSPTAAPTETPKPIMAAALPALPALAKPPEPAPKLETPPPPAAPKDLRTDVSDLVAGGNWRQARSKIASVFAGDLSDDAREGLAGTAIGIHQKALLQEPDEKEVELYEIRSGDTWSGIAKKFTKLRGVEGSIYLLNNYTSKSVARAGRKIRIPRGTWSIVVDKSIFKLYLCYEGAPFRAYDITIGTDQKTPAAVLEMGGKTPKPIWWPPEETGVKGPIPYGDPMNPLGEWWIALEHDLYHGLGIHGTNDPGAIGTQASNGCVRMLNEEIEQIAAIAYKGMVVTIVE